MFPPAIGLQELPDAYAGPCKLLLVCLDLAEASFPANVLLSY